MSRRPAEEIIIAAGVPKALRSICSVCHNFRAHGHPCLYCTVEGRYTHRSIESATMNVTVKLAQTFAPGHDVRQYIEHHLFATFPRKRRGNAKFDGRSQSELRTAQYRIMRAKQIRLTTLLLKLVAECFEKDQRGEYQVYSDRMHEIRAYLDLINTLVPDLEGTFTPRSLSPAIMAAGGRTYAATNEEAKNAKPRKSKRLADDTDWSGLSSAPDSAFDFTY